MPPIPRRRPAVLALHGFTLGGAMFDELAGLVAAELIAPDLPGHGGRDGSGTGWEEAIGEVGALIERHRPDLVLGYSMGGRLGLGAVLTLGAELPLVLVSSGLGIADVTARRARRAADEAMADRLEVQPIEDFIAEWEQNELVAGHPELSAVRLRNTREGLAAALRGMGQGAQPYLGDRLGELGGPSVWIAGAADSKYVEIAAQAAAAPAARAVIVPAARHNVVAAVPAAVVQAVSELLA